VALIVKLAEYGSPAAGKDKLTLKAEVESPLTIRRNPTIISLAGGEIVGIDLGKNAAVVSISGVVDYELTELFVDGITNGPFVAGEAIEGAAGWNSSTSPTRSSVPTATIVAGKPNLTAPTSLLVSNVTRFFVDNELITTTRGASETTILANQPFPTKTRLEQVARFWYENGLMTLTTRSGDYSVYIMGMRFDMQAGLEDRYNFTIDFAQASQDLSEPV